MKKDSAVKIILVSAAVLLILWLVKTLLFPTGYGFGVNVGGYYGGNHVYVTGSYNYGFAGTIAILLTFLIKVFFIVLVLGIIIALIMYAKNNVFTQEDVNSIKGAFSGKKQGSKKVCSKCAKEIETDWNVCPHCGTPADKVTEV